MKHFLSFAVASVTLVSSPLFAQAPTGKTIQQRTALAEQFYKQAERAFENGDKAATESALRKVFEIDPNHGRAYALALQLKKSDKNFAIKNRQKQLTQVILPVIDFQDMPFEDALSTLSKQIEEKSNNTVIPNFVIHDAQGSLKSQPVTLKMKDVPASVVLQYLLDVANASVRFDTYATVVRPR